MNANQLPRQPLPINGHLVTFSVWQRFQHSRLYINARGCHDDYIDLRTGEIHCSPHATQLLIAALNQPAPKRRHHKQGETS